MKARLAAGCRPMPGDEIGPFATLADGSLITVRDNATRISGDGGKTWSEPRVMYRGSGPGRPSKSGELVRTRDGVLVYVYMDLEDFKWSWSVAKCRAGRNISLDVWVIRSLNEGRTWVGRKKIFEGYCGALIDMIETSSGEIVVPIQRMVPDPSRHAICVYVSGDSGKSWAPSNVIDLGGHGHHDGAMEPTLVELSDGRLWMLIRTTHDQFWEAYSSDQGRSWRVIEPSGIDASSSPGYMLRLASGRLALVWNRLLVAGRKTYNGHGGDCQLSARPASWQREELSLAFSKNDGKSWSEPTVILRVKGGGPSYPYIFEHLPGEIWIVGRYGDSLLMSLLETDFA